MLQNSILQRMSGCRNAPFIRTICFYPFNRVGQEKEQINLKPVNLAYKMYTSTDVDSGAPPVFIMHGILGSKRNWNSISKAFLQKLVPRRTVISVDARNHGESPHSPVHTYPHLVEDVVALLKQLNIEKVAVIGHCMGGRALMYMALKYPNLVDRAVMVDISPVRNFINLDGMENIFRAIKSVYIPSELSIAQARKKVTIDLSKMIKDKPTVDFIVLNLKKMDNGSFVWNANVDSLHRNFKYIARFPEDMVKNHHYRRPVLFIGGSRSDFTKKYSTEIERIFVKSNLETLPSGHYVHLENPEGFIRIATRFLKNY